MSQGGVGPHCQKHHGPGTGLFQIECPSDNNADSKRSVQNSLNSINEHQHFTDWKVYGDAWSLVMSFTWCSPFLILSFSPFSLFPSLCGSLIYSLYLPLSPYLSLLAGRLTAVGPYRHEMSGWPSWLDIKAWHQSQSQSSLGHYRSRRSTGNMFVCADGDLTELWAPPRSWWRWVMCWGISM